MDCFNKLKKFSWLSYPFAFVSYILYKHFLKKKNLNPNKITMLNIYFSIIFLGIFVILIYLKKNVLFFILLPIVFTLHFILDILDGLIARCENKKSEIGGYLDNIGDNFAHFFLIAFAIFFYIYYKNPRITIIILTGTLFRFIFATFLNIKNKIITEKPSTIEKNNLFQKFSKIPRAQDYEIFFFVIIPFLYFLNINIIKIIYIVSIIYLIEFLLLLFYEFIHLYLIFKPKL